MGTSDGTVQGPPVRILNNGPDAARKNIILVAEGFTATQQTTFNNHCTAFVTALQAEPWYPILGDAINVHRLNVDSDDAGIDVPATCADGTTATAVTVDTYFDATFCNGEIRRCIEGDFALVRATLNAQFTGNWQVAIVICNTSDPGGCARGNVSFTSTRSGWTTTALHEMGHNFGLADEYHYWEGCSSGETGHDTAPAAEPGAPNITTVTNPATLKWRHLLTPGVPVPTMQNPDCTRCDQRANVLPSDTAIGLFEGAGYFHCGRYRPAYACRMRTNTAPFCRVCVEAIAADLNTFIPATPTMEVDPTLLDFGDVARGLTLYLPIEVRNLRSGRPGAITVSVSTPTGGFVLAPGEPAGFTLPAPVFEARTTRRVYVAFTAPTAGTDYSGALVVSRTDDPTAPTVTVTLRARAVDPPPVDSVLVIDRSGSMSGATGVVGKTKTDLAIEASELYVSLVKDNDQIGVVRYNDVSGPGDVLLGMTTAGAASGGAGRAAARATLTATNLSPGGNTSIGAGVSNASSVLDSASANARALVVLTDGRHNTAPSIASGSAVVQSKSPDQRVFAVGLGLNQLEDRLVRIASVTNGTAQITGDLVGEREFLLQKLYVQILSDVADEAFVRDPVRVANPGDRQATVVQLGETDVAADFIIVFRTTYVFPKYLTFELEAPDGTMFRPTDMAAIPNGEYVAGSGHCHYRWQFPTFPGKPHQHEGAWKVWVENTSHGEEFLAGVLTYSVMAKARSDLRLGGRIVQSAYVPGSVMEVVLEPTLFGLPVGLDAPVNVRIVRPDGVLRGLTLAEDEFGAYRATFTDTGLVGRYLVAAEVSATTPLGHQVTRFRQMTGLIFDPSQGGWDLPPGEPCEKAHEALEILHAVIAECCGPREHSDDGPKSQLHHREPG